MPQEIDDDWASAYAKAEALYAPSLKLIRSKEPEWNSTTPPASDLRPSTLADHNDVYTYSDQQGVPIGYVERYLKDGKKSFRQWSYGRFDTEKEDRWASKGFSKPLPVYNLHEAMANPGKKLMIVEGEGKVDAFRSVSDAAVAIAWPGGAGAVDKVDFTPLKARENLECFIWPDNDEPGRNCMVKLAAKFEALGYLVKVIMVPADKPEKWDVKDAILEEKWSRARLHTFIRDNSRLYSPPSPPPPPEPEFIEDVLPARSERAIEIEQQVASITAGMGLREELPKLNIQQWGDWGMETANGKPIANVSNISVLINRLREGEVWYDTFLNRVRTFNGDREPRDWTDADDIRWTIDLQARCGMSKVSKEVVAQGIYEHAYRDLRNELQDWLNGLPAWDGVKRIDHFFTDVAGAKDSAYTQAASRNFFISLTARAMNPGCKVDTMVILEGAQGAFKSSLLEIIGGKWYTIMRDAPDSKDFAIVLAGKWVIEIAELDAFSKSDVRAVKRALRTPTDRYRSPYGRVAEDHPRSSVFAGSTNRDDYNLDDTGFRHGWPISCGDIRLDLARTNRDQYFAEALAAWKADATWWEMPAGETTKQQMARYVGDPWTTEVMSIVLGHSTVTTDWVLEQLKLDISKRDRGSQMRVAGILRVCGWEKARDADQEGRTVRAWRKVTPG